MESTTEKIKAFVHGTIAEDKENVWESLISRVTDELQGYREEVSQAVGTMADKDTDNIEDCDVPSLISLLYRLGDEYASELGLGYTYNLLEELGKNFEDIFWDAYNRMDEGMDDHYKELVQRVSRNLDDYKEEVAITLKTMDKAHLINLDQCGEESLVSMIWDEADDYAEELGFKGGYALLDELGKDIEELFFDALDLEG